jgi:transcriptional regulator with XRE-family HTH domain
MNARAELAQFLRSRRARIHPADVGLPQGTRRRALGLRREEVAHLADVGVSWYTWLEQGRDIHVSEPLLERLARALCLTPTERAHLFALAHGRPAARPSIAPTVVSDVLKRVLDAHPFPAFASTLRCDVLAWNRPAALLYGDFGKRPVESRNGLWWLFTDGRPHMLACEAATRLTVARFRLDAARAADRSEFDTLAAALARESPEFARLWSEYDVVETTEGSKEIVHPELGVIELEHVALSHFEPDGRELRVTFFTPRPGASAERARKLFDVAG